MSDGGHFVPPRGRLGLLLCADRTFRTRCLFQLAGTLASVRVPFPFPNPAEDGPCAPEMRGRCRKFETCKARKEENEPLVPVSKNPFRVALLWGAAPVPDAGAYCPGIGTERRIQSYDWTGTDVGLSDNGYSLSLYGPSQNKGVPVDDIFASCDFAFLSPFWAFLTECPKLVLKRLCFLAARHDVGIVLAASPANKQLEPCMEAFAWRMELSARFRWTGGKCEHGWELVVHDGDTPVRKKIPVIYDASCGYIRMAGRDEFQPGPCP